MSELLKNITEQAETNAQEEANKKAIEVAKLKEQDRSHTLSTLNKMSGERAKNESKKKKALDFGHEEYLNLPGYSSSQIKSYESNPAMFNWRPKNTHERKQTDALIYGSLFHKRICEPEEWFKSKTKDKNGKEVNLYLNLLKDNVKKIFNASVHNVLKNKQLYNLIKNADYREKPYTKKETLEHPEDKNIKKEIILKGRIDILSKGWLVDCKTIADLGTRRDGMFLMKKAIDTYRYDLQLSFYKNLVESIDKIKLKGVIIVFLEKTPPYEIVLVSLSDKTLKRGEFGDERFRGWREILGEMVFCPQKTRFKNLNEI